MLSKNELYKTAEKNFHAFETKDIESITNMFDPDIILKDPVVKEVTGFKSKLKIQTKYEGSPNATGYPDRSWF